MVTREYSSLFPSLSVSVFKVEMTNERLMKIIISLPPGTEERQSEAK